MKKFFAGLLSGLIITSTFAAFSVGIIKSAVFAPDMKIVVNGTQLAAEPVTVTLEGQTDGSNYVPVKAVAEALGATVAWDGNNKQIIITGSGNAQAITETPTSPQAPTTSPASTEGKIKGNINSSGEKIYHMPGGAYYDRTDAEEYFDTEEEAQAAGYRKSSR